jgi:hypothetical protein
MRARARAINKVQPITVSHEVGQEIWDTGHVMKTSVLGIPIGEILELLATPRWDMARQTLDSKFRPVVQPRKSLCLSRAKVEHTPLETVGLDCRNAAAWRLD